MFFFFFALNLFCDRHLYPLPVSHFYMKFWRKKSISCQEGSYQFQPNFSDSEAVVLCVILDYAHACWWELNVSVKQIFKRSWVQMSPTTVFLQPISAYPYPSMKVKNRAAFSPLHKKSYCKIKNSWRFIHRV